MGKGNQHGGHTYDDLLNWLDMRSGENLLLLISIKQAHVRLQHFGIKYLNYSIKLKLMIEYKYAISLKKLKMHSYTLQSVKTMNKAKGRVICAVFYTDVFHNDMH